MAKESVNSVKNALPSEKTSITTTFWNESLSAKFLFTKK